MRGTAVVLVVACTLAAAPRAGADVTFVDAAGLHVVGATELDERQYDVTLLSDGIGEPLTG